MNVRRFLNHYHEWNCRAANGKQFTMMEHCRYGVAGILFLAALFWVLISVLSLLAN